MGKYLPWSDSGGSRHRRSGEVRRCCPWSRGTPAGVASGAKRWRSQAEVIERSLGWSPRRSGGISATNFFRGPPKAPRLRAGSKIAQISDMDFQDAVPVGKFSIPSLVPAWNLEYPFNRSRLPKNHADGVLVVIPVTRCRAAKAWCLFIAW